MEFRKLRGMESRPLVDTVRSSLTAQLPSSPPGPLLTFYYPAGSPTAPWRLQERQS